jgi:CBS domain containing-hemolysin-like protein
VGVIALDDIMAELYGEGRKATEQTAEEIIKKLEARNNYIPSSERVRKEYSYVLLNESERTLRTIRQMMYCFGSWYELS